MSDMQSNALVLTSPPGGLDDAKIAGIEPLLKGFATVEARWLSPAEAWEVRMVAPESYDFSPLLAEIRASIGERPIDVNMITGDQTLRRRKLLVADMDSTMIAQECIDELAGCVGLKTHVAAITERAMRGEIAFEPALRERVALLKGLATSVIDDVLRERITPMPGAQTLVATMRKHGAYACLVSGGFTAFVERVAAMLGFDESHSNILETENGTLNGRVREPILGREAKLATLIALRNTHGLAQAETLAVGDGANDLAMLGAAGLGVAYRAKPTVAAAAHARIDHCDLTALLYLQGYRRDAFVD